MQTIKNNWIYALFVFAVILFIVTRFNKRHTGELQISSKTFHTDIGWGYDIYTNDTLFIHQEFIPAIEGRKGFQTEAEAKQVANLSLERMKHRKLPMILIKDLDSLHISR